MAKLKVGDPAWWRGMRCEVIRVGDGKFTYKTVDAVIDQPDWVPREIAAKMAEDPDYTPQEGELGRTRPAFVCTSLVEDAKWDEDYGFWYLEGITGELPTVHIAGDGTAEVLDPDIPTCACEATDHEHEGVCGAVTWHVIPGAPPVPRCANCGPGVATPLPGGS